MSITKGLPDDDGEQQSNNTPFDSSSVVVGGEDHHSTKNDNNDTTEQILDEQYVKVGLSLSQDLGDKMMISEKESSSCNEEEKEAVDHSNIDIDGKEDRDGITKNINVSDDDVVKKQHENNDEGEEVEEDSLLDLPTNTEDLNELVDTAAEIVLDEKENNDDVASISFSSDAEGKGSAALALGETLDKCAHAIDEMVSELGRKSPPKDKKENEKDFAAMDNRDKDKDALVVSSSDDKYKTMKFKVEVDTGLFHRFQVKFSSVTELFHGFRETTIAMASAEKNRDADTDSTDDNDNNISTYTYSYKDDTTNEFVSLNSEADFAKLQESYDKILSATTTTSLVHVRRSSTEDNNNSTLNKNNIATIVAKGTINKAKSAATAVKNLIPFGAANRFLGRGRNDDNTFNDDPQDGDSNHHDYKDDKWVYPKDLIKIVSENGKFCFDVGTANVSGGKLVTADIDISTTRLYLERLDGPSMGYISTDHVVGIFNHDRSFRLDIGIDAVQSEQSANHDSWATCLYIRRIIDDEDYERQLVLAEKQDEDEKNAININNKMNNEPLKYGELVGVFASEGAYIRMDIGLNAMKKAVPADHNSWATRLCIQKKKA